MYFWGDRWEGLWHEIFPSSKFIHNLVTVPSWVFFLSLASGGDLDSIHVQRFYLFKGCNGCQGIHQKQRLTSHVLPWSHAPNSPGLHLSTFTLYNLQNEWVRPGGQWGWRWRFRPRFLLAQKLWVHVRWIWKSRVRPFVEQKKTPWRWSIHFDGNVYALVRSSSETERVTKVGFSCEYPSYFFSWKFWGYTLDMYHGTGKNPEETCGTCGSNVPLVAFIWK